MRSIGPAVGLILRCDRKVGNPFQTKQGSRPSCPDQEGRNINNLRYADDTTLMAESEEELKSFLMKVKKETEKFGLKLNIQKTKIIASNPITSWHPVPSLHGKQMGKQWKQ